MADGGPPEQPLEVPPSEPPSERSDPGIADTSSPPPVSPPGSPPAASVELGDTASATAAPRGQRRVRTGDALGRYELGDELGEGGMATVYRARDRELRRDVAVKVLFPHLARRPDIVRRFHREARAAAGLEHPNILRIYDVGGGEAGDPPYIVMELIRGRTLLQEIEQRGAMLAEVTACVGALLGDALAAAHAAGIIHRDVKPANVLIAPGGRLLLADFGVARLETEDSLVTRTGALLGTPAYMSPEQAAGDIATARSDLYSLGATLYQLATGALPYAGPQAKVMSMIASGALVAPVRRRPACGADLSREIERLMAADPAARPASAIAVAGELRALAADSRMGDPTEELAAYFEDPDGFLRVRTPVVVAALVAAATAAVAEGKLPRAMALADRASALLPADPSVVALIRAVTEGGHASRRKRAFAIAGGVLAAAGGIAALGWQLASSSSAPDADPPPAAVEKPAEMASAREPASGAGGGGSADRAAPPAAPDPARGAVAGADSDRAAAAAGNAGDRRVSPPSQASGRDAAAGGRAGRAAEPRSPGAAASSRVASAGAGAGRPRGSAAPVSANDALPPGGDGAGTPAAPAAIVPAPFEPPAVDAGTPAAVPGGHLVVRNDVWCNLWIDGNLLGNRRNEPIEVTAGHHVVRCVNPIGEWTLDTDVASGATRTLTGTLLRELQVTLDVEATIDGKHYDRGAVVRLKPGNIEVIAGGKKQFITFRTSCRLKDTPELGCYL